jgi:hypothetical protein
MSHRRYTRYPSRNVKPQKQKSSFFRSDNVNELYYARDNTPNFHQFKTYHFKDDEKRLYMITEKSNKIFENEKFGYQKSSSSQRKKCIVSNEGYIKLFVKLPNSKVSWFSTSMLNRAFYITEKISKERILIKIRGAFKFNQKRLTGTIFISNVTSSYCNTLLNA